MFYKKSNYNLTHGQTTPRKQTVFPSEPHLQPSPTLQQLVILLRLVLGFAVAQGMVIMPQFNHTLSNMTRRARPFSLSPFWFLLT